MGERQCAGSLALQQSEQVFGRARLPEYLALSVMAIVFAQEVEVADGFDSLGDDLHAKAAAHVDDGAYDGRIARIVADVAHEGLVDLESADRELLQGGQRRVPGA